MSDLTLVTAEKMDLKINESKDLHNMTMFAAYLKEREGVDLIETDKGFAIYNIRGEECYVRDIYVPLEHRQKGVASTIADKVAEVARKANCKYMTGSVCPTVNGSTTSMHVLLGYGMRLHSASNNLIIFIKDL